ncbi:hypothetical protein M378DRAFT_133698 [Amanita muscaria Koide BX008]|uniref:Clp1 n=1 Tax=Amanita muscaria (strain Koide BX008) TaxID=946122 RepID=A0A0C2WKR2_AMAMK|nr:hypothetical protein M378DRAFT_133698 [Amanita muscaria Koide BX008]
MVARFVTKSRAHHPHHNRNREHILDSPSHPSQRYNFTTRRASSCAPVKRILGKQQRGFQQMRAPLSNKSAIVNRASETIAPTTAKIRLPRTLPRPALREIDTSIIDDAFPVLKGLPPQYIRDSLAVVAPHMLVALRNVQTSVSSSCLPSEVDVELSPESEEARANPPTHMLAVYASSSSNGKTKVTLFPSHQLVFSAHCANLPALPPSSPSSPSSSPSSDTQHTQRRLLVVPFRLPVPATFPLLYSYLYTKRADVLLESLEPEHGDMASLTRTAALIQGLWQNTCVLGVVDNVLYDTLDHAWGKVMSALETTQSSL